MVTSVLQPEIKAPIFSSSVIFDCTVVYLVWFCCGPPSKPLEHLAVLGLVCGHLLKVYLCQCWVIVHRRVSIKIHKGDSTDPHTGLLLNTSKHDACSVYWYNFTQN